MVAKPHGHNFSPAEPSRSETLAKKLAAQGYAIYGTAQGKELARFLGQIVSEKDAFNVYSAVGTAAKLNKRILKWRGYTRHVAFDPLASLHIVADLREYDRSAKIELDKTNRANKNQPTIAEVAVGQAMLLATMMIGAFGYGDDLESSSARGKSGWLSKGYQEISQTFGTELGEHVVNIMQDALKISVINLGGKPSQAHAYSADDGAENDDARERNREALFFDILRKLPGHAKDGGLMPEGMAIRVIRHAGVLADIVDNPEGYSKAEVERICDYTRKVIIPLTADWRRRAHKADDINLAATFDSAKAKMRDLLLQIEDPEGYAETQKIIVDMLRAVAPERTRQYVTDIESGKALVLGVIADETHSLLPTDLQDLCKVQARIKSVASTYAEIKKNGRANLRDVLALRIIKRTSPQHPDEAPQKMLGKEGAEISKLHWILKKAIIEQGKYVFEEERYKNLYKADTRKRFFESRNREDNGYYSVQDGMLYGNIPIEIQVRSERAHNDAEFGDSSHDLFKNYMDKRFDDNFLADAIPVRSDINEILPIGAGGTVADYLVAYYRNSSDPALAFSAEAPNVKRPHRAFDSLIPAADKGFATPLMPGDQVMFAVDTDLRNIAEHRRAMIDACRLPESKKFLRELDSALSQGAEIEAARPSQGLSGRTKFLAKHL